MDEVTTGLRRRDVAVLLGLATALSTKSAAAAEAPTTKAAGFERGYLYRTYDVAVDPDVLVDMIADWGRLDKYLPSSLPEKVRIEYRPGSEEGKFPCQRRSFVEFPAKPGALPVTVFFDETLLTVDVDARTLIYRVDGLGPDASRNFIASVEIDDVGGGRSRLALRARFDLPAGGPIAAYSRRLDAEYVMLSRGFEETAPAFIRDRRPAFRNIASR